MYIAHLFASRAVTNKGRDSEALSMSCYGGGLSPGPVVQATRGAPTGESAFSCQQKVWKDLFIVSCDVPSPPHSPPVAIF